LEALDLGLLANLGHCARLARAGFVLAREGAFVDVDPQILPPLARAPLALANLMARRSIGSALPM
jgi:ubiquinone biosynthesis protein